MVTYEWTTIRDNATRKLGVPPSAALEEAIIERFRNEPLLVIQTIDNVHADRERGQQITSPWAVIKHRITQPPPSNVIATDENDRRRRIQAVERWIHHAGVYIDREPELLDELFGDLGRLREWADDLTLRARMLNLWRDRRPAGETAEHDAVQRHAQHVATRLRLSRAAAAKRISEPGASGGHREKGVEEAIRSSAPAPVEPDTPDDWHLREPEFEDAAA